MENKNDDTVVIIVILMLLLGLGIFVAYDKGFILNKDNNKVENNKESNEKHEETEITDIIVKDKLDELINKINKTSFHPTWYEKGYSIYEKSSLSESSKLLVILKDLYSTSQFQRVYKNTENGFEVEDVINLKIVKDEYKNLFNEELTNYIEVGFCPWFKYDQETNKYKVYEECGGTGYDTYISYNNRYTEDENNMYVYVNVGRFVSKTMTDENGLTVFLNDLYADVSKEKIYKKNVIDKDITINESNYNEFSEYKYIFGKDKEGRFYYKNIERIR